MGEYWLKGDRHLEAIFSNQMTWQSYAYTLLVVIVIISC